MVAITEPFRSHWEAEDEYRKLAEREERADWLRWFLGTEAIDGSNGVWPSCEVHRDTCSRWPESLPST